MPTYATLFTHTDHGKQNIETIPTEVFPLAQELTEEIGGEVQALYYGNMGEYDGISIATLPDGEAAEQFRLALEREGTHRLEQYEVFEAEDYFEMIEEATR